MSGREHGPRYATIASVSSAAVRQAALDRSLEQPRARLRRVAARSERVPARDLLEDDAAPTLAVALAQKADRSLDPLGVILGRLARARRSRAARTRPRAAPRPSSRAGRPGWLRSGGAGFPFGDPFVVACVETFLAFLGRGSGAGLRPAGAAAGQEREALETLMGANGDAWLRSISPDLRSSSNARSATACSTREKPSTSASKSNSRLRVRSERKRSTNCETGGKRSAM